ncbi:MAG TPA: VIT1/CCC1 transporter family protein [Candidatus Dormibacteraeota bacterium]
MAITDSQVVERLLQAWRGEIEARTIYEILAERERDPARANILRRLAAGEAKHRERLEARLVELGHPAPDPATVRISRFARLQARLAPIERVLMAREAAEQDEVEDGYRRSTGDPETDRLFADIRHEEWQHSKDVAGMGAGERADAQPEAQSRLNRILRRETWHQTGSGWISGAIYGANDGLAAVFGIVSGVSGATGGSSFVLTAGLAGTIASALSMATGAYLAERSTSEVAAANLARERKEIEEHPDEEREELSLYYQLKGLTKEDADDLAEKLSHNPDAFLSVLAVEELGGLGGGGDPVQAGLAAGISTGVGALIPVLPFFFLRGISAVIAAAAVSLTAHFLVGAAKSLFTLRSWWAAGLEMTAAGVIVGGATYAAGLLFHA